MSKYTTEVRFICEQKSGLTESVGFNSINEILDKSWDKIFTKNWEIFDESYRKILCEKILRSYYTREICAETVGLWQLWLDATLCEIMPTYNQLYNTTIYEFNPLYNTDMTTTFTKTTKGNNNKEGNSYSSNNSTKTDNYTTTDSGINKIKDSLSNSIKGSKKEKSEETNKYNDTPQGGVRDIVLNNYLTDIRIISRNNESTDSSTTTGSSTSEGKIENTNKNSGSTITDGNMNGNTTETSSSETTETWTERVMGKNNGENYGQLLIEFRKSIINIDKMIIDDLKSLFMQLW